MILGTIAATLGAVLQLAYAFHLGYEGGYARGRVDEQKWVIHAGCEVDKARGEIWREE